MRKGKSQPKMENKVMAWLKSHSWEILLVNLGYAAACTVDLLMSLVK